MASIADGADRRGQHTAEGRVYCARKLKKRTLTNLYNQRPAGLDNVHKELDAAVAAAYGWPADLTDEETLERLFALNQARAGVSPAHAPAKPAAVA